MSLSQELLIELMSLADGELEGDDKARAERLVAESEEARRALDGMRAPHVALWLTGAMDQRATAAGADGVADAVMGAIAAAAAGSATVVPIGEARRKGSAPARPGGRRWVAASLIGISGLAAAAGVAMFIHSTAKPPAEEQPVASVGLPSVDMQAPGVASQGVEVDDIDSPSRGISVFEIPLSQLAGAANVHATGSSVVVWIDETEGERGK